MFLLDTNVLSEVMRPRPAPEVIRRLLQCTSQTLFASEVTRFELRFGAALRADASVFWARVARDVLPLVTWLPVDAAVSSRAGDIAAAQRRAGRPAGSLDPLIAATALVGGLPLVTRNVQHFDQVPGLRVQNWFEAQRRV
jgi:predicted nucleic acid-binding protein